MANEAIIKVGTPKTLEANGASIANNALAQADDYSYGVVADGGNYPHAEFALTCAFTTAPTEGTTIVLLARPLNVDGTLDTEAPETTRGTYYVGVFVVNNVGSSTNQTMVLYARDVPREADYYLYNNGTGQSINAGWVLKVTPRSIGPA